MILMEDFLSNDLDPDVDGDGINNDIDPDDDNDGILDIDDDEVLQGTSDNSNVKM